MIDTDIEKLSIDVIRFLAAEAVEKAKSGHPGMCIGNACTAYALWTRIMNFNAADPRWINRDRFVLSAGHGSMLLYTMLHLCGYDWSLADLKQFRQVDSKTPGHPEYDIDLGIEVTTGPLAAGLSNAVGMAICQKYLASHFNREGFPVFDYNIYVLCGDGCQQEGLSSEASSLAGHLALDNLVVIYDDNHISIDGDTALSFTEDVAKRYEAYGWNVIVLDGDGNDLEAITEAVQDAKSETQRPTLIKVRTHIALGAPNKQDTAAAHGAPLGADEIRLMKEHYGWDPDTEFHCPDEVYDHYRSKCAEKQGAYDTWQTMFADYSQQYPDLARQIGDALAGKLPFNLDDLLPTFEGGTTLATRQASGKVLNALMPKLPLVVGGSADLTPSNNTLFEGAGDFQRDNHGGRYIRYGVREHAMGSIMNGIAVSGLVRPYSGTFLVFSDYMRGAIRIASIAKYPTIFVFTHDSIGLGEDGPTHQPVEHLATLRALPNFLTFRPADANETAHAWKYILEHPTGPVGLCLTRQGLPVLDQNRHDSATGVPKGAYCLVKVDKPDCLILATGSEVALAMAAGETLGREGVNAQIVSMPCWELFEQQSQAYKDEVIPPTCTARVGVEAAVELGWHKYIGCAGEFVGMTRFGSSGPQQKVFEKFGITTDAVVAAARRAMGSDR